MIVKTVVIKLVGEPQQNEGIELFVPDALMINQSDPFGDREIEVITIRGEDPTEVLEEDGSRLIRRASMYQRRRTDERLEWAIGPESSDDSHANSCLVLIKSVGESAGPIIQNGSQLLKGGALAPGATYTDRNWLFRISPAGSFTLTLKGERGRLRTFRIYWDEGDLDVAILEDVPATDEWRLA